MSTSCTILVKFSSDTSEFMLLTIVPFVAIRQKSAYHAIYLRIFWTYHDLLYTFGRRVTGIIFQVFVWQPPKGRCYGNQLNMVYVCKRLVGLPLLFASAFDNGLADRKSAFKAINGNNQATSFPNLVNLRPVISEFTLLKRVHFAAIRLQFYADFHSSRWRFQTDWKNTILILAE